MPGIDRRNRLAQDVFSYRVSKDGKMLISWEGRQIMVLKGVRATRILAQIDAAADDHAVQLVLARVTGNFKHGNER